MASIRANLICEQQPSIQPRVSTQHCIPLPTHKDVIEMLTNARSEVQRLYAHIPRLCAVLSDTLIDCVKDNGLLESNPICDLEQVLMTQVRVERGIISAYNKHRLGGAKWHHEHHRLAEGQADYSKDHNLLDQLDTFPFHSEVVRRGFKFTALDLRPLYQVPEYVAVDTTSTPGTGHTQTPSKKSGRRADSYGKLVDAPSAGLAFPNGNITLAEIAAFLPESIKSWDVIDRIVGNDATSATIAQLINHFRDMPRGHIMSNTIYRSMKGPMNSRAKFDKKWKPWSVGVHNDIADQDIDATSVSVAGFRRAGISAAPAVPFQDLAKGVKIFPSGHDALDLTRCVEYCQENPNEKWLYPNDFARLLNHLPSGPAQVEEGHQDASIVERWTSINTTRVTADTHEPKLNAHTGLSKKVTDDDDDDNDDNDDNEDPLVGSFGDISKKYIPCKELRPKRKRSVDDSSIFGHTSPRPAKRRNAVPKALSRLGEFTPHNRSQKERRTIDLDSDSDSDSYQGPKRMKKRIGPVRSSGRTRSFTGSYSVEEAVGIDEDDELDEEVTDNTETSEEDAVSGADAKEESDDGDSDDMDAYEG
ncbi:hypothetical protein P153DRAFT_387274 [Dothidotthia symphoricarpi CBS 119687]|uniref:Uncharacterized protein n=1 Tax=Dothidotthia symphoricarpi CBS 119687 TaxID=1392245 RepID=A0A6A6AA25_9PLEO|nr:uncharacterized protein P153DRAFT_387274 [Dothidotthia symphoricarpi CBS 119687]KAF2127531.1 hypothetical protein P153DRAFT_387274 [Dothidotthia symphoricarpi CBS 119687]